MNPWAVIATGSVIAGYAAVSRRLSSTCVSGPMVFVSCGLAIGPLWLDLIDRAHDAELARALLESALALVLFTGAASIRRRDLRRERSLPSRLLAVGLPLTMAIGWLVAWAVLPGLSGWELAVVAIILAPTDAALGEQAVSNSRVPAQVRHGLSVESGLNDGIVLPFFLLALAAAGGGEHGEQGPLAAFFLALVASSAIGLTAGWLGARVLRWSALRRWSTESWRQILILAVPATAYALCVVIDGSGFIGAWTAGLAFGSVLRTKTPAGQAATTEEHIHREVEFSDRLGEFLAALSFVLFGGLILGPALQHADGRMVLYAVLSLTVIRMVPVVIALWGTGLRAPTVAYIGWFGPRGLASVVFGLIAFEEGLPGTELLSGVVAVTVALSVYLHGASAVFLGSRYGSWYTDALRHSPDLREGRTGP
ncbi:cation:proton antiporter [Streptomyces albipurpureus]|uniref:Cation:proton antiporter n=1 Tax=Streptomyces albipurpureus TaxID=2897419 RepID=A0ABT0UVD1_9ACTN|nr:cation:proton antiporter [Streptomyces sp. CWNU-1]MCM2392533.1 cation:proton antiporter [Streptomyces sp. CWNU-1]